MNKKITACSECNRSFWYVDPRPGGRPRQKCGICSSRPPRYPWGFIDADHPSPPEEEIFIPLANDEESGSFEELPATNENHNYDNLHTLPRRERETDEAHALEAYPLPVHTTNETLAAAATAIPNTATIQNSANLASANLTSANLANGVSRRHTPALLDGGSVEIAVNHTTRRSNGSSNHAEKSRDLSQIEARLDEITRRLERLEEQLETTRRQVISRTDWIDLSARLDIVEQNTSETLGKVRSRLDGFTKEVRQIAVVPERELHEMFELVRLIRRHVAPDQIGNS